MVVLNKKMDRKKFLKVFSSFVGISFIYLIGGNKLENFKFNKGKSSYGNETYGGKK